MAALSTYIGQLIVNISPLTDTSLGAGSASIVSAALELNTGTGSDSGGASIDSGFGIDADESTGHFEITALPTGGRCDMAWADSTEDGYRLRLSTTQFTWARLVGGAPTTVAGPTTWDAGAHKWARIREASGTTYLEMAPDSGLGTPGSWSTIYSEATGTSGWTHTAIDMTWFAPAGAGTGVSRYRYLNTTTPLATKMYSYRRRRA